ncbi:MAG: SDR family oxidoreductase [Gammaproteobacteria bacterium]
MARTILITGASSGIGRETALRFQREGWNVAATMRSPEKETELNRLPGVICPALDVTRPKTIASAIEATLARFGRIDAVVNNAGYGLIGAFETFSDEQIERQFQTNVFGLMAVTRAVLPHFRAQRDGVIVNVASFAGRSIFPMYSVYHASKWAVEGFSDSLQYEVKPYGIRVKIIEPGIVKTEFWGRSTDRANVTGVTAYDEGQPVLDLIDEAAGVIATKPEDVADAIWKAANDRSDRQRWIIGLDAHLTLLARKVLSDGMYRAVMNTVFARRQVDAFRKLTASLARRAG